MCSPCLATPMCIRGSAEACVDALSGSVAGSAGMTIQPLAPSLLLLPTSMLPLPAAYVCTQGSAEDCIDALSGSVAGSGGLTINPYPTRCFFYLWL